MIRPAKRPATALGHPLTGNTFAETTQVVRTMRGHGVQETTAGTIRDVRGYNFQDPLYGDIPDASGYDVLKNPDGRQSIQKNPEDYSGDANSHAYEWQLHNVHKVKRGSGSVPVFFSEVTLQGASNDKIVGELYFATVDSDRYDDNLEKLYRSLDVADTHSTSNKGRWNLSLYGFTACSISHVPYAKEVTNPAGSGRELEWRYPVTCANPTNQDPCNSSPVASAVVAALSVGMAGGSYATLSYTTRDLTVDRASLAISAASSPATSISVPVTIDWSADPYKKHTALDFSGSFPGTAGQNDDHDARYLRINASWFGGTYNNTTNAIAHDTSGKAAIDFSAGHLYDRGALSVVKSIDYALRELWATGNANPVADWQYNTLMGSWYCSGGFTAGYNNKTSTIAYSTHTFYSSLFKIQCDANNDGGIACWSKPTGGYNYFLTNDAASAAFARFGTDGGSDRVNIMDTVSGVDRTLALKAVDGTIQAVADGTNKYVYLNQVRLMVGNSLSNWIEFVATNGQLRIVDQAGNELANFTTT